MITMKYHTAFRFFLTPAASSGMIASTAWNGRDHAISSGATEKDTKYRDIFHCEDGPAEAELEKSQYGRYYTVKDIGQISLMINFVEVLWTSTKETLAKKFDHRITFCPIF